MLLLVAGPSAAGKTHLARLLVESAGFTAAVAHTTRPPRAGEVPGDEYLFVSQREFAKLVAAGEITEWTEVLGHRYGYRESELARSGRVVAAVVAEMVPILVADRTDVRSVFVDAPDDVLLTRLRMREPEERMRRLRRGQDVQERAFVDAFDLVLDSSGATDNAVLLSEIERLLAR